MHFKNNPNASRALICRDRTRAVAMRINGSANCSIKPEIVHNNIPFEYILDEIESVPCDSFECFDPNIK